MQLSIIIVNYNVKYFLEQCLCSVIKACKNIEAEIFVVDNNSTDGSKDFLTNRFEQVKFIWKNENAGFAKANNEALELATGKKILFLNPDTIVPEDCFEKCLHFFDTKNNMGALGIRMIDGAGNYLPESKRGFPTVFTSFCKMIGLTALFPYSKLFANYYLGHLPQNKNEQVDVLAGACMMVDKKVLDTIGSFDESFFMYAEDIDLSYRIQKTGYKNYYFADTTIIHFKGESTKKLQAGYVKIFYGAMLLFVKKHYSKGVGALYVLLLQFTIAIKAISVNIKNLFRKASSYNEKKMQSRKVFVVADEEKFERIQQSLYQYFIEVIRVEANNEILQSNTTVVFCEPSLSFKELITQMEQSRGLCEFFIHADNSKGIIGSGDKNRKGIVYVI